MEAQGTVYKKVRSHARAGCGALRCIAVPIGAAWWMRVWVSDRVIRFFKTAKKNENMTLHHEISTFVTWLGLKITRTVHAQLLPYGIWIRKTARFSVVTRDGYGSRMPICGDRGACREFLLRKQTSVSALREQDRNVHAAWPRRLLPPGLSVYTAARTGQTDRQTDVGTI